jgi:hypothetical protein
MGKVIFASWWRFHGELPVSPPTQAQWYFALLLEVGIGGVHNDKEVSR